MKHISIGIPIAILFSLIGNYGLSQTADYFGNSPTWHEYGYGGIPQTGLWSYTDSISSSTDTVIAGNNYHVMNHSSIGWSQWVQFVRQDQKKIYYYDINTQSDSLLVDYDLSVGDTLEGRSFSMYYPFVIHRVDSLLLNGNYYKQLYTDTTNNQKTYLVEGVGYFNEWGQNVFGGHFANVNFHVGVESIHHLCYGQLSTALFPSTFGEMCSLSHASLTSYAINNPELVYDPVSQLIFIEDDETYEITIYSINGQTINHSKQSPLRTMNIESGIYFVVVKGANYQFSQRVYIQN